MVLFVAPYYVVCADRHGVGGAQVPSPVICFERPEGITH